MIQAGINPAVLVVSPFEFPLAVESECGAVTLGRACVFPPLSFGGALVARP